MKKYSLFYFFLFILFTSGCQEKNKHQKETVLQTDNISDIHSFSNVEEIQPQHLDLDLRVDFEKRQISGSATWKIHPKEMITKAIFDTRNLHIDSVLYADGSLANFHLGENDEFLGKPLHIELRPDSESLQIFYKTQDNATALQWLTPEQTFGKQHPYLYTQSESIHVRTWIPAPDSPGARFTYNAKVEVPEGLLALMSAENPQVKSKDGKYYFTMNDKIPGYLIALAVGDIAFHSIDHRTGVYAEPVILKASINELEDIGKMVENAEALYGEYRWGRYDVLMLPSGFPIGGMENPRLTFATPTILSGDKSLTNLIAHELAHSWRGNLVTNETWEDFWLNEGFTTYFEQRIMEETFGKEYSAMLWNLSERTLRQTVSYMGENHPDTRLKIDLKDRDPDLGFTDIPYEKGSALLLLIEQTVGRKKWDDFLRNYFDTHAFQTMNTEYFIEYLNEKLLNENPEWKNSIDIESWVYGTGIPKNYPHLENLRFKKLDDQIEEFVRNGKAIDLNTEEWSAYEWMHFIGELPKDLSLIKMHDLDYVFDLTHTKNSEVADLWYLLALHTNYEPAFPAMKEFLYVTGREKFLEPLYKQMMQSEEGKEMAKEIYKIARNNYHPLTQKAMDEILDWKEN